MGGYYYEGGAIFNGVYYGGGGDLAGLRATEVETLTVVGTRYTPPPSLDLAQGTYTPIGPLNISYPTITRDNVSDALGKIEGLIKAAEPFLPASQKAAAQKIEKALDQIEKGLDAQTISEGDAKAILSLAINEALSGMAAADIAGLTAIIVGAVGAETGPFDVFLAAGAGGLAWYAYTTMPLSQFSDALADGIVNSVEAMQH